MQNLSPNAFVSSGFIYFRHANIRPVPKELGKEESGLNGKAELQIETRAENGRNVAKCGRHSAGFCGRF